MALHLISQSSIASLTTPCTQHNPLRKSQKDGAVSALAIPLQPLSPLPARNTILCESLKRWRCICSHNSTSSLTTPCTKHNPLRKSQKNGAVYMLSQFHYSLSRHSLHVTQSFKKVSKRWRCICSRNSSTASLTTPYMQHNPLLKSQKDGAASALAIPLQPLSPLPARNTFLYEIFKKMALYLLSQFLHGISHNSLHATQSFTKDSKRWRCIYSRNSSTASLTTSYIQPTILHQSLKKMALHLLSQFLYCLSHHSLHATNNPLQKSQKDGAASALAIPLQPLLSLPVRNTVNTKVTNRVRCIWFCNSSTASFTIPYRKTMNFTEMKKSGRGHRVQWQKPFFYTKPLVFQENSSRKNYCN